MLTQKPVATESPTSAPTADPHVARKGARPQDDTVCWFEGGWTRLADAKVSIMTHSFLYGTAVFEGIRAYWNADDEQLYLLKARPHFERIVDSSKILLMHPGYSVDEMVALTTELLTRNGYREDCYVRATVYKSDEAIGVKLHDLESRLNLISIPFGDYIATDRPISCGTVSWRRTGDLSIPSRGKVVGSYVNPAFSKTEAVLNGYEEAIVLDHNGHVSEGSAENLFLVRKGRLITPGVNADILEGVTRAGIVELAEKELGLAVEVRDVDRSELYVADEVFLCGTGAQVSPVSSIDHRTVGNGAIGPITGAIMAAYFDAVRGRAPAYRHWVQPVY
jgi:branched-chain amino acid aminotransferase